MLARVPLRRFPVQFKTVIRQRFQSTQSEVAPATTPAPSKFAKWVPIYGAIIGTCALMFQIGVLYPWHEELSDQFTDMLEDMDKIKAKERRILELEERILAFEAKNNERLDALQKKK